MLSHFFFFLNHTIYEIMWKNIVESGRPEVTIWHMCIVCYIPKATYTHSEYVILLSSATVVAQMHFSVILYLHCLSCVICVYMRLLYVCVNIH